MDFQYQLSSHSVAEIGYTGVRGRKLLFGNPNLDLTQLPTNYLSLGHQLTQAARGSRMAPRAILEGGRV